MNNITMRQFIDGLELTYPGKVSVNGKEYLNIQAAKDALRGFTGKVEISFTAVDRNIVPGQVQKPETIVHYDINKIYRVKVRRYMTQKASPAFDFQSKFNDNIPMPYRIMVGKVIGETKGMVKMTMWAEMVRETETVCMKCGRTLTNSVSRYFGIGPECGGHGYTNPFDSDDELNAAVKENNERLSEITWEGWIIKSAIEELNEI